MRSIVVDSDNPTRLRAAQSSGSVYKYTVDANMEAVKLGTSVSGTPVWTIFSGNGTLGTAAVASNVATNNLTTANTGTTVVKVVITYADGQKAVQWIEVRSRDPDKSYSQDYGNYD